MTYMPGTAAHRPVPGMRHHCWHAVCIGRHYFKHGPHCAPGSLIISLRKRYAAGLALITSLGLVAAPAMADDRVVVLDRSDVQKLRVIDEGFRTAELIGTEVQGNAGGTIGEIENFVVARGGYLYAVIDTNDGLLEELTSLGDDETIVVPWDQLRTRTPD